MNTPQIGMLRRAMDAYTMRMQAQASNIANLDTPGYKRLSVSFEDQLQDAIHNVPGVRKPSEIEASTQVENRPPQLEDELMEMADTQMRTQVATRALREQFDLLRAGVTGRSA